MSLLRELHPQALRIATLLRARGEKVAVADGADERAGAYRAFVTASYLDSLATQRGIGEDTRERAEFLANHVRETLDSCRERWE